MNTFNKRASIAAIVAVSAAIFLSASAFMPDKRATVRYQYNNATSEGIGSSANWTQVNPNEEPAECQGEEIPCTVTFDDTEYANMDAFLAANPTLDAILASGDVSSLKNEP